VANDPCRLARQVKKVHRASTSNLVHVPDKPAEVFVAWEALASHPTSFTCQASWQGYLHERGFEEGGQHYARTTGVCGRLLRPIGVGQK
jgi:hypothetical protein